MTKSITRTSGPTNKNLNARNVGANITQCSFSVEEVGFLFDKEFMTFTNADAITNRCHLWTQKLAPRAHVGVMPPGARWMHLYKGSLGARNPASRDLISLGLLSGR
jgi:hypothetical protein